jgi:hypothetical protein
LPQCKAIGDKDLIQKYRSLGMSEKTWEHTLQIFEQAERLNPKNKKRAGSPAESDRDIPNPIGWRAG